MHILIFSDDRNLKPIGGPIGYLYNISEHLKKYPNDEISFFHSKKPFIIKVAHRLQYEINKLLNKFPKVKFFYSVYMLYYHKVYLCKKDISTINKSDYVHVHHVTTFLQYFENNNKVEARVILTSHNPEPYIDELANQFRCGEFLIKHQNFRDRIIKRELDAYKKCYKIMFPVPEAREPYMQLSYLFDVGFKELESKFFYIPTALGTTDTVEENDKILESKGIDDCNFKICYIGRHNTVKGYDFLEKVAPKVFKRISDSYFIIGGKEEPIKGLNHPRWFELGWVNTAKLLNEVDVFILPNQQTYFDLILLEVLRQGTPLLISRTGGNKWFENKHVPGLFLYEYGNQEDFIEKLFMIKEIKDQGHLDEIKAQNKEYCKREFNMQLYLKRYMDYLSNAMYIK